MDGEHEKYKVPSKISQVGYVAVLTLTLTPAPTLTLIVMEAFRSLPSATSCLPQRELLLPAASASGSHFCGELFVPSPRLVSARSSIGVRARLKPDDAGVRPLSFAGRIDSHSPASPSSRHQRTQIQSAKKTYSSFDDLLNDTETALLVDFYATWCGPCQFMVPVLDDVGKALKDKVRIVKVDSEKYPNIANRYGVQALPTLVLFQNGQPIDRLEGAMTAPDLIRRIEGVLSASKATAQD